MKIVCTVTNDLAQDQRMDRICRSLAGDGHEVTLVGRLLPSSKPLSEKPYATHRIACKNNSGKSFYLEYNYRLWLTLRNWEFDAICAVDLDTLLAGWLLKTNNRKLVFDAHEWFSETPEVVTRPFTRFIWKTLGRWLAPRADMCYTVAPVLAKKLAEEYRTEFAIVRNLPRRSTAENSAAPEDKTILYQGMLNPGRGLEAAIHALQWLPGFKLLIVGSGPLEGGLRRCSEELGVQGQVEWAGFCPPEELPEITRRAWLGLNLLDAESPSYYYSLANKALDYVQSGLPSVQMDFPEYRHLAEQFDCYELIPDLNPKNLAVLIRKVAENPERYHALRRNCLKAASVLCWEKEETILLNHWKQLFLNDLP